MLHMRALIYTHVAENYPHHNLVFRHSKKKQCALYGKWTECLYAIDPAAFEARKKNNKKGAEEKKVSTEV